MITARELIGVLSKLPRDSQVRIADVSEEDDLHCSVGDVVMRSGFVILVPGNDDVWRDETLSSSVMKEILWPKEDDSED